MDSLVTLIGELVQNGTIADTTLLLIIISLIGLGYQFVLKPLLARVEKTPTTKTVADIVNAANVGCGTSFESVSKRLDKLLEVLNEVEGLNKDSTRDIKELRRDVEQIKQILNQFQGHLMYGGGPSHFGNRELK